MCSVLHRGLTFFFNHKYVYNRVFQTQKTHCGQIVFILSFIHGNLTLPVAPHLTVLHIISLGI